MFPTLEIGPLVVPVPAILILLGLWLGLSLAESFAPRCGITSNHLYNLVFFTLIASVIGARLSYALRYPEAFSANPTSLLSLNTGLLDPWGMLLAGIIAGLAFMQYKKLPFWETLDALTPFLAVMGVALGLSHLASGAAFGEKTSLPVAINLWGAYRHPSQIYETIAAAIILILIWPGRGKIQPDPPGVYFCSFVACVAGSRLILEAFRGDSLLWPSGIRIAQVLSWVILAACMWGVYRLRLRSSAQNKPSL